MARLTKYVRLTFFISLIVILLAAFSSKPGKKICNSSLFQAIQEREIDASALFYTESDIPVNAGRKLEQQLKK